MTLIDHAGTLEQRMERLRPGLCSSLRAPRAERPCLAALQDSQADPTDAGSQAPGL